MINQLIKKEVFLEYIPNFHLQNLSMSDTPHIAFEKAESTKAVVFSAGYDC